MSELRLEERLREAFVPEEGEAEVRGWRVVHGGVRGAAPRSRPAAPEPAGDRVGRWAC